VRAWGGVTIASQATGRFAGARLNHEEVVRRSRRASSSPKLPIEAVPDARGALSAMVFKREGQVGRWVR
jgi:hypothetical protein